MEQALPTTIGLLIGYGIGSISFALVAGYLVRGIDIRTQGSGNVGATNVGRILGRPWGVAVYLLDFGKGLVSVLAIPPLLGALFGEAAGSTDLGFYYGIAAIVGHMFPFYLRFRGGKGVATGSGVLVSVLPIPTIGAFVVWGVVLLVTRYMALASMAAAVTVPVLYAIIEPGRAFGERLDLLVASLALAGLVVIRHRSNILRLAAGTESRIGGGSKASIEEGDSDAQA